MSEEVSINSIYSHSTGCIFSRLFHLWGFKFSFQRQNNTVKQPPFCFSHFHTSKSKKEAQSEQVTTIKTIYQSEQWCDFIEPTDATFAVIAAALVPTPP